MPTDSARGAQRKGSLGEMMDKLKIERARALRPEERLRLAIQLSQFCALLRQKRP